MIQAKYDNKLKSYLKVLVTELSDSNGDMYDDVLSKAMHYRVKMKLRRIIKEAHEMLK